MSVNTYGPHSSCCLYKQLLSQVLFITVIICKDALKYIKTKMHLKKINK
jgi:hypothetical protein